MSRRIVGVASSLLFMCVATRWGWAQEARDPFMFGAQEGAQTQAANVLAGVLWDEAHPLAMVAGRELTIGDTIAGWTIAVIRPDAIVIERGRRRETVPTGGAIPSE
ncbi:MAG: hypothetical protein HY352_04410 [Candidatus Omnitrophica bacterium]|nr:hypothetical protein [Candidatus Omnitrophota bacterium]